MIRPVLGAAIRLGRRAGPVRLVSPVPPHEPEPYPDEPFAPVYDFTPLAGPPGRDKQIRPPRHPDALAFGPPGSGDRQNRPREFGGAP